MRTMSIICAFLLAPNALCADTLSRFFPTSPSPVPALWWLIDTSSPLSIASIHHWFVESAPGQPAASLRSLPSEGVGIGLLAAVPNAQGDVAVREVMPPWPLNSERLWPPDMRYRQVSITEFGRVAGGLSVVLPLPVISGAAAADQALSRVSAELYLPRAGPAIGPYRLAIQLADLPLQEVIASDRGDHIVVPLTSLLEPWPLADAERATLNVSVSADASWSPASISSATPALWRLSWQSPSALLSGRSQWQRVLASLLMHTGARTAVVPNLAAQLDAQVQGQTLPKETQVNYRPAILPSACGGREGLLLGAATLSNAVSDQLTRWLDEVLQGPTQPYRSRVHSHGGRSIGTEMYYATPLLGRGLWRADHDFRVCSRMAACDGIGTQSPSLQARVLSGSGRVLSDSTLGSQGQLTLDPHPERVIADIALGDSVIIDSGADPTQPTGRAQYILWLGVEGTFLLRDGNSGELLWRWQPSVWQAQRTRLQALPAAVKAEQLAPHALQLWSGDQNQRVVYAVLDGQLVGLDMSQPLQPRLLALATPGLSIDSVTLLPDMAHGLVANAPSHRLPELLLGVRAGANALSSTPLIRINGINGSISWRAEYTQEQADDPPQWLLPWTFIRWQNDWRGYGVDTQGRIWRLNASAATGLFEQPMQQAALAGDAEIFASLALSIQTDANGRRRVAISMASRASPDSGVLLSAWLDDERREPLSLSSLPSWSTAHTPPAHTIGWQRQFSSSHHLGLSPKWLDARVLMTLETVGAPVGLCLAAEIQTTLYDLPWRSRTAAEVAKEIDLGTAPTQLAEPVVSATGELTWTGQTKPNTGLGVSAYRRRLSKVPVRD